MNTNAKKRWRHLSLAFGALLLALGTVAVQPAEGTDAASQIRVIVRGEYVQLSAPPVLAGGTSLVPVDVARAFGAELRANDSREAVVVKDGRTVVFTAGRADMNVDGRSVRLPVAPRASGGVLMVPVRALAESFGLSVRWDAAARAVVVDGPEPLPVVGNENRLKQLLRQAAESGGRVYMALDAVVSRQRSAAIPTAKTAESATAAAGAADYARTNVQVEGVDEADIAKTDGKFIYQIADRRVFVVDVRDPAAPKLAAVLEDKTGLFSPMQLYVRDRQLIVVGQQTTPASVAPPTSKKKPAPDVPASDVSIMPVPPIAPDKTTVKAVVYDLSDLNGLAGNQSDTSGSAPDASGFAAPKPIREVELEGYYLSSRLVGSALYIVANKFIDVYRITETNDVSDATPIYRDTAVQSGPRTIGLEELRYFPNSVDANVLTIGALDLDQPDEPMQVSAYLGSGEAVYASPQHLYIAVTRLEPGRSYAERETAVYKFRLDNGRVFYSAEGRVPGTVLNQFSMDEYDGKFRIATTAGDMWRNDALTSRNNLYVLDEKLAVVGKLENLAPGERIYSVRFMGKRAYLVTFRKVDPLFTLDLSDSTHPKVLGQLKIPGYSDYLHPYDENQLIGFGKDTIELPVETWGGKTTGETMAFYQGMKIALFDVTDPEHPKEKFKAIIGDRGTDSELLRDHKALLFSREKGLLAFPVQVMEIRDPSANDGARRMPAYGEFVFQGAYVYRIDPVNGFRLRGKITHLSGEDLAKAGMYGYDYGKAIRRILYVGTTLYTLSDRMLQAHDLDTLAPKAELVYPAPETGATAVPPVSIP